MDLFLTASLGLLSWENNDCCIDWWYEISNPKTDDEYLMVKVELNIYCIYIYIYIPISVCNKKA